MGPERGVASSFGEPHPRALENVLSSLVMLYRIRELEQVERLLALPLEVFLALDAIRRPRYGFQSCSTDFVAAGQALPKAAVSNATKG